MLKIINARYRALNNTASVSNAKNFYQQNMCKIFYILLSIMLLFFHAELFAQSLPNRHSVVRIEETEQFPNLEHDDKSFDNQKIIRMGGFGYYTTSAGIYIHFKQPNNNVKLFAVTGQLIWSGELVSGHFFISTGEGIYFLRVNNKSYKIICK